tara:strand:- start:607 stop:1635 length:1029 start_codon:yes stop_codon:yes gene_type:complete
MSLKNSNVKIKIPKFLQNKLKDKKISIIYRKFENTINLNDNFLVAVSGGPDSLALAFLSKIYSLKNNLVSKYFIINHGLRPDSLKEAKNVQSILKKHSISAKILNWEGKKPISNVQSIARKKRYQLLFKECDKLNIQKILLGHHKDDLIENFFIRLLRGSGLKGLISLDKISKSGDKFLLRPLLNQTKDDLIFVSKKVFNFYINDPTNKDEKYLRIRLRRLIEELKKNGLDTKKFNKTIANLKNSNNVVNFYVDENLKKNSFYLNKKNKVLLNKEFFQQPYEVIFRAISDIIKLVGGKYYASRGKKLDNIIEEIEKNRFSRVTLGGCIIEKVNQTIIVRKEH